MNSAPTSATSHSPPSRFSVWFPVVLVAVYWICDTLIGRLGETISGRFLPRVGIALLLLIVFTVWWLGTKRFTRAQKLSAFGAAFGGLVAACYLNRDTWQVIGQLFLGIPLLITVCTAWLWLASGRSKRAQFVGLIAAQLAVWTGFCVTRPEGIDGDLKSKFAWRWSETKEQTYLRTQKGVPTQKTEIANLSIQPGDWPNFRGPQRNGIVTGVSVSTDWANAPPREIWRRSIGPAWSSMLVVGGYLFTQEQRGDDEAVVCLDASTGQEVWSSLENIRFYDSQAGPGPRATPAYQDGKLYTVGGTGIVLCLDASTGKVIWQRDLVKDTKAAVPIWGFSSTPLPIDDVLINFAGGPDDYGLIAYRLTDGEPVWHAATGPISYCSPTPLTVNGVPQVVQLTDHGLVSVAPKQGTKLWEFAALKEQIWRAAAPQLVGEGRILFGSEDLGLISLKVENAAGGEWQAEQEWQTSTLKPAYNDFVILDNYIYGFNGGDFSCIDAATGKKKWRGGQFGHGQVLALADQKRLIVQAESGEVVLLSASPDKLSELGRVVALHGKTWNHPAIAQGKLFVRNDEEMVCYDLATGTKASP